MIPALTRGSETDPLRCYYLLYGCYHMLRGKTIEQLQHYAAAAFAEPLAPVAIWENGKCVGYLQPREYPAMTVNAIAKELEGK